MENWKHVINFRPRSKTKSNEKKYSLHTSECMKTVSKKHLPAILGLIMGGLENENPDQGSSEANSPNDTPQGTNMTHLCKRKHIFPTTMAGKLCRKVCSTWCLIRINLNKKCSSKWEKSSPQTGEIPNQRGGLFLPLCHGDFSDFTLDRRFNNT